MNYIEQINNFWAFIEEKEMSSSDISVYFSLLKYNNSLNWMDSFRCDYSIICQYASVSKNTFYKSINKLSDLGLISYKKGERNILKPRISILKLKNRKGIVKEQNEEQNEEQKGNLYKLLNYKTIKLLQNHTEDVADFLNENLEDILKSNNTNTSPSKSKSHKPQKVYDEKIILCTKNCLKYFPEHLKPKTEKQKWDWVDVVDKLNRIDGYELDDIVRIVKVTREDNFWKNNFLSLLKLRSKDKNDVKYITIFNEISKRPKSNRNNKVMVEQPDYDNMEL